MKLYFAGTEGVVTEYNNDLGIDRYLISLANFKTPEFKRWCQVAGFTLNNSKANKKGKELFLDCGAFSIRSGNSKLTFYDYIDFVQRYGKTFDHIASFDVIPDAEKTYNNYKDMLSLGLDDVIPTYHYPESVDWFDKYCKMTDYVAIGGVAGLSFRNPTLTYNFIQKLLQRKPPNVKIHLFGITANPVLKKFGSQIESVDSTAWLGYSRFTTIVNRQVKAMATFRQINGRRHTKQEIHKIQEYNIRRYQELENDINSAYNVII